MPNLSNLSEETSCVIAVGFHTDIRILEGYAVAKLVEALCWKVAGSIPDVIGFFN
jgi:hypothetical protein